MAKKEYTFEEIYRDIVAKRFATVYVLMGEEAYFIDQIEEALVQNVLNDSERDFNQQVFYGNEAKVPDIINTARRFPMMSKYQLVIIREAQNLQKIDLLSHYIKTPAPTTVFVICHKHKKIDGRKSLMTEAKKNGVVFESKKIYDNKMPGFIISFMKRRGMDIDPKSVQMLSDHIGNDLCRLDNEAGKLLMVLGDQPVKRITAEMIETNIGISKEYNSFEFVRAVAAKDVLRANRISDYFDKNPKVAYSNPVLPTLFNYFANLMICFYSKDRSENGVIQTLRLQWSFQAIDYMQGLRNYTAMKAFDAIHEIRMADAKSKGFGATSHLTIGDIYKEMLCKIMC
jgi:DNA polymerase-3 subunit delta